MNIVSTLKSFMPTLVLAGDYALKIQDRVQNQPTKEGPTIMSQALTDADLSVQGLFEVEMIANHPEFGFEPEEADKSLNLKYFPTAAEYSVLLDPINGTAFYRAGMPIFDIILTIAKQGIIVGAVTYIPARGIFYLAARGQGAFTTTREGVRLGHDFLPYRVPESPQELIMTYRSPAMEDKLAGKFDFLNLLDFVNVPESWDISLFSVLTGRIGGYMKSEAPPMDWGAIAFILEEGGGIVTDFSGQPIPDYRDFPRQRIPSIFCCASREMHARIMKIIS